MTLSHSNFFPQIIMRNQGIKKQRIKNSFAQRGKNAKRPVPKPTLIYELIKIYCFLKIKEDEEEEAEINTGLMVQLLVKFKLFNVTL